MQEKLHVPDTSFTCEVSKSEVVLKIVPSAVALWEEIVEEISSQIRVVTPSSKPVKLIVFPEVAGEQLRPG